MQRGAVGKWLTSHEHGEKIYTKKLFQNMKRPQKQKRREHRRLYGTGKEML